MAQRLIHEVGADAAASKLCSAQSQGCSAGNWLIGRGCEPSRGQWQPVLTLQKPRLWNSTPCLVFAWSLQRCCRRVVQIGH
ncbi:hypothetical protein HDV63DRAFT_360666 [Trichoderma sp. SZMC 28014]